MGRGNPAFFMPERKVDRAWIREKTKDRQLYDGLGWVIELVVATILGHLAHTRIKGIGWIQLTVKGRMVGLGAVQMPHVVLSRVFGADAVE